MKALCSDCKQIYDEKDEENFIYIEENCPMICYDCVNKMYQPERSKREDDIM